MKLCEDIWWYTFFRRPYSSFWCLYKSQRVCHCWHQWVWNHRLWHSRSYRPLFWKCAIWYQSYPHILRYETYTINKKWKTAVDVASKQGYSMLIERWINADYIKKRYYLRIFDNAVIYSDDLMEYMLYTLNYLPDISVICRLAYHTFCMEDRKKQTQLARIIYPHLVKMMMNDDYAQNASTWWYQCHCNTCIKNRYNISNRLVYKKIESLVSV